MGAELQLETRDPDVIPIGPRIRPTLVRDTEATEAIVIPLHPGMLQRPTLRRRSAAIHVLLAGLCWVAIALL